MKGNGSQRPEPTIILEYDDTFKYSSGHSGFKKMSRFVVKLPISLILFCVICEQIKPEGNPIWTQIQLKVKLKIFLLNLV